MKNVTKKKLLIMICIVFVISNMYISQKQSRQNKYLQHLMQVNIQALAEGETGNLYICYGIGSVDCPNGTKVEGYMIRHILEIK